MTVLNIFEQIQQIFPEIGETQILLEIDKAQKEFCSDTKILTKRGQLTSISTNTSWSLPSDCADVTDIEFYDSDDLEKFLDELYITYSIQHGILSFYSTKSNVTLTGLPSPVSYAYIDYVYLPTSITYNSDSLTIPEEYHEAILARVLEKFYARFPVQIISQGQIVKTINAPMIQYWNSVYNKHRIEAKKQAYATPDKTKKEIKYDFFGYPLKVIRTRPTSSGSIPVTPLGSLYTKYYRFTATSPSTLTENISYGFSNAITLAMNSGNIIVTSSAEFNTNMFIITNQGINYSYISTSQIELYPPTSWGTLVVEIYQR